MTSATRTPEFGLPLRFFRSAPRPCAYLPDRLEQLIFAELDHASAMEAYDTLTHAGFRRSHNIIYRPACANCAACIPVRIVANAFTPQASMKRVLRRNEDISGVPLPAIGTAEQYAIFRRYQLDRHHQGDMADMTFSQYRAMVEETTVDSFVAEFRGPDDVLLAGMLADRLGDGISAVYSFFEPSEAARSLGTHMILWLIDEAKRLDLPYVYLGYWIEESPKMSYKTRFRPIEALGAKGWQEL